MTHNHGFHIDKLKNNFNNIITLKREISKVKRSVTDKLTDLKKVYNDLIKANTKKIFIFCLDSFYFQYKTFAMEMEHIDRFRALMNNRMYCDYYKLYNIIINDIKENRIELNIDDTEFRTFTAYKDLEPFDEYKIEEIKDIHTNILVLVNRLYSQSLVKTDNMDNYNDNHKVGFSISNFLNTLNYENQLLRERITLYTNYISFFHISQKKQLNRLYARINDFYKEIDDNININRTFSIEDIGDEDRIHRFYVIGEEIEIESILEDSEFLMESADKVLEKLEKITDYKIGDDDANTDIIDPLNNITIDIVDPL
jgi:hypothetical protein